MGEQYETKGATRYAYDLVFKDETTARGGPIRADQDLKPLHMPYANDWRW